MQIRVATKNPLSCFDQSTFDCDNRDNTVVRNAEIMVVKYSASRRRLTTCRLNTVGNLVVNVDVGACVGASVGVDVVMIWCSVIEAVSAWSRVSSLWNPVWSLLSKSSHSRVHINAVE